MASEIDVDGEKVAIQVNRLEELKSELEEQRSRFERAHPGQGAWSQEQGGVLFANSMTATIDSAIHLVDKAIERAETIKNAFEVTMVEVGDLDESIANAYNAVAGTGELGEDPSEDVDQDAYAPDEDDGYWADPEEDDVDVDLGVPASGSDVDENRSWQPGTDGNGGGN